MKQKNDNPSSPRQTDMLLHFIHSGSHTGYSWKGLVSPTLLPCYYGYCSLSRTKVGSERNKMRVWRLQQKEEEIRTTHSFSPCCWVYNTGLGWFPAKDFCSSVSKWLTINTVTMAHGKSVMTKLPVFSL